MAALYLVRHGQASFGSQNYDQLSDLGLQQAQHLGRWWAERDMQVSRVVTGSLLRHQQTAEACLASMLQQSADVLDKSAWQVDAGFNEYNHHEVLARHVPEFDDPAAVKHFLMHTPNGKQAFQEIFAQAVLRWISGQHDHDYSETWLAFRSRCVAALEQQLLIKDEAKNIVIFTSGGTISALCQHVLGFPDLRFGELNWSLVNSAVTRFHLQANSEGSKYRPALAYLNNFSHLEVLNNPKAITYV
ncbi:histidine phosphatase family protein [Undibacterium sp. TS12]|uniref:histidine phosphatase family protein n=1 Tax=Undibacterium sp. TS12 TaxID=2908202 RepID=UPI001F4CBA62|nr:histidine phosphatase family protein [Undibacterium sp. TS12]MCH8620880.1 histidine phosphatase family protein [Undibacterium sp. TS12]